MSSLESLQKRCEAPCFGYRHMRRGERMSGASSVAKNTRNFDLLGKKRFAASQDSLRFISGEHVREPLPLANGLFTVFCRLKGRIARFRLC